MSSSEIRASIANCDPEFDHKLEAAHAKDRLEVTAYFENFTDEDWVDYQKKKEAVAKRIKILDWGKI